MKTRIKHIFTVSFLLVSGLVLGQKNIQGTVVAQENGEPLPGVTIVISGSDKGTTSDFDGNFEITVNDGDALTISYLGFETQEVTIGEQSNLTVQMVASDSELDEVVVMGYGTQTKKEVTGAVAVVTAESIEKLNPVRIEQALQGQVAGVNITSQSGAPGSGSNIRIRGISTNGDNRPLILVDGNVIEDLSVINPKDIQNINVLKDAAAGIYGVRAANGVILITTKGGRKEMPLTFQLDSYAGMQNTSKQIGVLNATEYGAIINESQVAAGNMPVYSDLNALGIGTNWQKAVFQEALMTEQNLSATGGTKKLAYGFGAGFMSQDGIVGGDKANFTRFTGRANLTYDLLDNLQLKSTAIFTQSEKQNLIENAIGSVLFNALNMYPTVPIADTDGEYSLADGLGAEVVNPIAQIANTYNTTEVTKISATLGAEYTFLNDFSVQSRFQYNHADVAIDVFSPVVNYGSGKVLNVFRNALTDNDDNYQDYTWDSFLTFDKTLGSHKLKVMAGMSVFKTWGEFESYTGYGLPSNEFGVSQLSEASEIVDANEQQKLIGANTFDVRLLSYFSRLQYNFNDKYLLSAVIRRDGSTRFGPNNRFGIFPSASLGWVVSEENFFKNDVVSFLKLRASHGIIGNDRIGDYRFLSTLAGEAEYVADEEVVFGKAEGALSNPDIKWEEQISSNIGLDATLFDGSVNLTLDYFQKKTENLLLVAQVSGILGAVAPGSEPPTINAGTVENKGFEFLIGYNGEIAEGLRLNASYNFTTLQNEVLFVASENGFEQGGTFGIGLPNPPSRMEAGQPIGFFYGYETNGIYQSQAEIEDSATTNVFTAPGDIRYVDQNNDGEIDLDDRVNIGDPIPDITMGFNFGFSYKNLDFNASTFASLGNEIVRNYERNQPIVNRVNTVLDRWRGTNTTNLQPRVTASATPNRFFSDYYVEDGSYVRIQNVQLGYNIPENDLKNVFIEKARIYGSVNNLYTFSNYSGFDPSASNGAPLGGGIDIGFYPVPRTYLVGLNLTF